MCWKPSSVFTPVALTTDDYLWVLRQVAACGARSGLIYDALILKCAERAAVDVIYTWNMSHFLRIACAPSLRVAHRRPLALRGRGRRYARWASRMRIIRDGSRPGQRQCPGAGILIGHCFG